MPAPPRPTPPPWPPSWAIPVQQQEVWEWRDTVSGQNLALFVAGRQHGVWMASDDRYYKRLAPAGSFADDASPLPIPLPSKAADLRRAALERAKAKAPTLSESSATAKLGKSSRWDEHPDAPEQRKPLLPLLPRPLIPPLFPPKDEEPNYGVDKAQIVYGRYWINGRQVGRSTILDRLRRTPAPGDETGQLSKDLQDDSARPRLTLIGSKPDCDRVLSDLASSSALSPEKARWLTTSFRPDAWQVRCGFHTHGSPVVYCQAPNGKVLHRQDVYEGPEQLAEALRKAHPDYRPDVDPNLTKPKPKLPAPGPGPHPGPGPGPGPGPAPAPGPLDGISLSSVPPMVWIALGLAGWAILASSRRQSNG
jgi:hypothetical protein